MYENNAALQELARQLADDGQLKPFISAAAVCQESVTPGEDYFLEDFATTLNFGQSLILSFASFGIRVELPVVPLTLLDFIALQEKLVHRHFNRDRLPQAVALQAHVDLVG